MLSFDKRFNQSMNRLLIRLTVACVFPSIADSLVPPPRETVILPQKSRDKQKGFKLNTKGYRCSNKNIRKRKNK